MNGFPPGSPGSGGPFGPPPQAAPPQPAPPPLGQNAAGAGQAGQVQAHYCFSGTLSCSGCNPCDACALAVKQNVLVPALLEEQAMLGQDLQIAFQQGRPVDLQLLADTFFRMCAAAWRQMHQSMQSMPAQNRPFKVMNVTKVMEAAEIGRQILIERERAAAVAAAQAHGVPGVGPNVAMPNIPPQNIAVPASPPAPAPQQQAAPSHVMPQVVMPSKPVDFDRAMRAGGEAPPIITVQAEEPGAAGPNGGTRPVTTADFERAAPPANGADTKAPS